MKLLIACLFLVYLSISVYGQQVTDQGKLSAKILDSANHTPVDYATVNLYLQGSKTPAQVVTSDPKGNFYFSHLSDGEYSLTIGFMGYRPYTREHIRIKGTKAGITLPVILLVSTERVLKGVNITAQTPAVKNKIDKIVYDPSNDLSAQGGNALDVLKKVPTLTVDIDGNVELLGSPGVNFLINGKPSSIFGSSLTDALQSIPSSQIKNIEVISNPGAKYDSQGTGGVVNIVLKDSNLTGVNGTVNLAAGTRQNNGSFNLNARKDKFGINAFFSGNNQVNTTSLNSRQLTDLNNVNLLDQKGSSDIKRNGYQTGISFDYNLTPKDDITASLNYNKVTNRTTDFSQQTQTSFDSTDLPVFAGSTRNASTVNTGRSLEWTLGYKKKFRQENQSLDFLYQSNINHNLSSYNQLQEYTDVARPTLGTGNYSPGRIRETGIEVNYAQPFGKNFILETGGKAFFKTINSVADAQLLENSSGNFVPDPSQSYGFKYDRNIFAYYLSASFKAFSFLDVKAGARYEYTVTHADFANANIPNYGLLSPTVVISHAIDDAQLIKVSYSRRVERPDYRELNPFINRSDPYNLIAGNPALRPEIADNFEAGYSNSFKNGTSLNITAFHRHSGNDIQGYTIFYPTYQEGNNSFDNVSFTSRTNTGAEVRDGMNIYASIPLTGKLTLRSNAMVAHKKITYNFNGLDQMGSGMEYRINLNVAYQFPSDLAAEVFGNYNSSRVMLQGNSNSFLFYTMAVRKQFFHKNASLGISATDPFNKYINQRSTILQTGNQQYSLRQVPYRSFAITLSFKFGNLKFDKKDETPTDPNIPSL